MMVAAQATGLVPFPAHRRYFMPESTAMHPLTINRPLGTRSHTPAARWNRLRILFGLICTLAWPRAAIATDVYLSQIKPLFTEKCISCHGPLEQSGGLRLDAGELVHRGGDSGAVMGSAAVGTSILLERVLATDDQRMPPPGEGTPLDDDQIAGLRSWLAGGAPYPKDETYAERPEEHWAFQSPVRQQVATLELDAVAMGRHPVDALLTPHRLRAGVRTAERADTETLLRRLTIDLTGLPPTASQRESVIGAAADNVLAKRRIHETIDRLLADPAYAQRWGRHWMDVWRYSDWDGYKDELRGSQRHIWRWRDWIIESLAEDKPYDQMIVEMLAADEVAPLDFDRLRATGFLARNYHRSNRNIWLDATVEHTAKAFLGLTIDCAKCHDHKYDPISQAEYYRFRAIFEPYQTRTDLVAGQADFMVDGLPRVYDADLEAKTLLLIAGDEKRPDETQKIEPLPPSILALPMPIEPVALPLWAYIPNLHPVARQTLIAHEEHRVAEARAALARAEAAGVGIAANQNTAADETDITLARLQLAAARAGLESLVARLEADDAKHRVDNQDDGEPARRASQLQREQAAAESELQLQQKREAFTAIEAKGPKSKSDQKAYNQAKEAVQKAEAAHDAAVQALTQSSAHYASAVEVFPSKSSGRRLALARWVTHPRNPLTARVAINHIWLRHFGRPLVDNIFDFGLRSPRPVHADLLDWLALELIESGWSMKHIHRLIVTSDVYAMGSQLTARDEAHNSRIDPENKLYWKFQPIRLEGEVIRDSLLAIAGQLDHQMGGPEIDHQKGETEYRRSLYFRHAYEKQMTMLTTFDGASPNECYRRDTSIIPQQALVLANSELARASSQRVASEIAEELRSTDPGPSAADLDPSSSSLDDRFIRAAFIRVLGRRPSVSEQEICRTFLADPFPGGSGSADGNSVRQSPAGEGLVSDATLESMKLQTRQSLVHALINHNDFVTVR